MALLFRQARDAQELAALLRYRHERLQATGLGWVVKHVHQGMEYDAHDLRSEHFGLFDGPHIRGTVRITTGRTSSQADLLNSLIPALPDAGSTRIPAHAFSYEQAPLPDRTAHPDN